MAATATATKLKYEILLEEEKLTVKDLPPEIKKNVSFLSMDLKKLADKPTDALKKRCDRNDTLLADMIQTWIEKDMPAEPAEPAEPAPVDPAVKAAADKAASDKIEADKTAKAEADKVAADKAAADKIEAEKGDTAKKVIELQDSIVVIMNTRNQRYILKTELTNILGREPKDNEKIGTLNLCQVYLSYPAYYKHY